MAKIIIALIVLVFLVLCCIGYWRARRDEDDWFDSV